MSLITRRRALYSLAGGLAATAAAGLITRPSFAKGNLAHDPVHLPELKIDTANLKYSQTHYDLETGKYYWWPVSCDGEEEDIGLYAPELFAASWINQVVSGDDNVNEVHTQSLGWIEFDGAGSMIIQFIPLRPGQFNFYTPGYEDRGLKGTVLVQ